MNFGLAISTLIMFAVSLPANAVDSTTADEKPVVRPPDDSYPNTIEGMGQVSTFLCRLRSSRLQPHVTLEIDFDKKKVNEIPALISPVEVQWVWRGSQGRSVYYRLHRKSGFLQGVSALSNEQTTGWCERIRNR